MRMTDKHTDLLRELGLPSNIAEYAAGLSDSDYLALEDRLVDEAILNNRRDGDSLTERGEMIIDIVTLMARA